MNRGAVSPGPVQLQVQAGLRLGFPITLIKDRGNEMLSQRRVIASCENDGSPGSNEARETQRFHSAAEDVVKTVLTESGGETDKWEAKHREEGRGRGKHSVKNAVCRDGCGPRWDDH